MHEPAIVHVDAGMIRPTGTKDHQIAGAHVIRVHRLAETRQLRHRAQRGDASAALVNVADQAAAVEKPLSGGLPP